MFPATLCFRYPGGGESCGKQQAMEQQAGETGIRSALESGRVAGCGLWSCSAQPCAVLTVDHSCLLKPYLPSDPYLLLGSCCLIGSIGSCCAAWLPSASTVATPSLPLAAATAAAVLAAAVMTRAAVTACLRSSLWRRSSASLQALPGLKRLAR